MTVFSSQRNGYSIFEVPLGLDYFISKLASLGKLWNDEGGRDNPKSKPEGSWGECQGHSQGRVCRFYLYMVRKKKDSGKVQMIRAMFKSFFSSL